MSAVFEKIRKGVSDLIRFVGGDIWRVDPEEEKGVRRAVNNVIRILILAGRSFQNNQLILIASALTYFTLLSLVPILSLVLGVAKGFGAQDYLKNELLNQFQGHGEVLNWIFNLVDSMLQVATKGVVIGIGIVFILWSIWAIANNMERAFNTVWRLHGGRNFLRKMTNLLALLFLIPILLIISTGVSVFIRSNINSGVILPALSPMVNFLLKLAPFVLSSVLFTLMYVILPNTRVKVKNAIVAGLLSGMAFQVLQYLFINGQLWVNRYNAMYGSFAVIPIVLLWLQTTWIIILFGAEISYATQNIRHFMFEKESDHISQRCYYLFCIKVMGQICRRFEQGVEPATQEDITTECRIPVRLAQRVLNRLTDVKLLTEYPSPNDLKIMVYQPAVDIHKITVERVFLSIFRHGEEGFGLDADGKDAALWKEMERLEASIYRQSGTLVKDL